MWDHKPAKKISPRQNALIDTLPQNVESNPVGWSSLEPPGQITQEAMATPQDDPRGYFEKLVNYLQANKSPYQTKQILRDAVEMLARGPMGMEKTLRGRYGVGEGSLVDPQMTEDMAPAMVPFSGAAMGMPVGKNMLLSIGGVGARRAPLNDLRMAEKLAQWDPKATPKSILKATSWMQDPSGRWMFEIPDHGSNMFANAFDDKFRFKTQPNMLVGDVISHPELFRNYPDLKDLPVVGDKSGAGGTWQYNLPAIALREGMEPDATRRVLLHELAHAVQSKEQFTNGSSPDAFLNPKTKSWLKAHDRHGETVALNLHQNGFTTEDFMRMRRYLEGEYSQEGDALIKQLAQSTPKLYQDLHDYVQDRIMAQGLKQNAYEQYRGVSGEQVAEAVARRADLLPDERKNRLFFEDFDEPFASSRVPMQRMRPGPVLPYGSNTP